MTAEALLSRLDGVRARGPGQWSARCPAHDDRGPSLSVKELPDGRMLMHCFAGCEAAAVLEAMSLDMADLFPPRPEPGGGTPALQRRRLLPAGQALELLRDEATLIAVAGGNAAAGIELSTDDLARVLQAAGRVAYLADEVAS